VNTRADPITPNRCVSGAAKERRCGVPAEAGSDYCSAHGFFRASYLLQQPPSHPDRERMQREGDADLAAARNEDQS